MKKYKIQISDDDLRASSLSPEHLQSMGRVVSEATFLDMMIEKSIWALIGVEESVGRCITTHLLNKTRIDILRSLANKLISDTEMLEDLDRIVKDIDDVQTRRNRIIHDYWIPSGKPDSSRRVHHIARKSLKVEIKIHSIEEINKLADKTRLTAFNIATWSALFSVSRNPSPDKS